MRFASWRLASPSLLTLHSAKAEGNDSPENRGGRRGIGAFGFRTDATEDIAPPPSTLHFSYYSDTNRVDSLLRTASKWGWESSEAEACACPREGGGACLRNQPTAVGFALRSEAKEGAAQAQPWVGAGRAVHFGQAWGQPLPSRISNTHASPWTRSRPAGAPAADPRRGRCRRTPAGGPPPGKTGNRRGGRACPA